MLCTGTEPRASSKADVNFWEMELSLAVQLGPVQDPFKPHSGPTR